MNLKTIQRRIVTAICSLPYFILCLLQGLLFALDETGEFIRCCWFAVPYRQGNILPHLDLRFDRLEGVEE